jgi:hypothetical protein
MIESLEERYSKQWNEQIPVFLEDAGIESVFIKGISYDTIEKGSFLDISNTHLFKFAQLSELIFLIQKGEIKDKDTIFLHDGWFPGIESLFYIRNCLKRNFKIKAYLHAGTYDSFDFLKKAGCGSWGHLLEDCWFSEFDSIFVATNFHKKLILSSRVISEEKIKVVGMPFFPNIKKPALKEKKKSIIFPHRMDEEKNPNKFKALKLLDDSFWKYLFSKEKVFNKKDFYSLLEDVSISVSFADQETFGIAMYESALAGCFCLVPNRLSYSELFHKEFLYDNEYDLLNKLTYVKSQIDTGCFTELQTLIDSQYHLFCEFFRNSKKRLIEELNE